MIYSGVTVRTPIVIASLLLLPTLTGCSGSSPVSASARDRTAAQQQQLASERAELAQIPLPSKTQYLAVKTLTNWQNPYLTEQGEMLTLHVTLADANPSQLGIGGMLRPVGARRQDLNIRTSDLASALNAVPQNAWPYGRVVAVEEAHDAPASALPGLRRNMELAIKTLNDVGIVVYEWQDGGPALR